MAIYTNAMYFLIDNDKLSENQNFDDFQTNFNDETFDKETEFLSVQSRHQYSAWVLSEFLQASGREGELKFLTEARSSDDLYILITSDLFEGIISEINELLLWCRNNTDKIWIILKYNNEPDVDVMMRIIDEADSSDLEYDSEGYNIRWVFAYLKEIIKMIHQAQQKQQFIVCLSYTA